MAGYVAYYRVSTDRQGASGLGLDAQREAVRHFIGDRGQLLSEFTEVESGRWHTNRPQLLAALDECRRRRAVLLIARLDRLAHNVAFIANLMESGADFVAVDMPEANRLTIHILDAVAKHEREMISKRTKAALAQAKARGTRLGNPNPLPELERANKAKGDRPTPPEVLSLMGQWKARGKGLREIARDMNRLAIRTPRGCQWYAETVKNALAGAGTTSGLDVVCSGLDAACAGRRALQTRGNETSLIKYIARKEWWHVPPCDPEAYQKRGKFYSSTFREAEFYGRPGDPERVTVQNPLVGDEATVEQTLFRRRYSESFNDMGGARLINARFGLDAKIKAAALKRGFDAVVLMAPSGFAEYLRSGKIPRSLELNILTSEQGDPQQGDQAE